jgi:hypothetical protein
MPGDQQANEQRADVTLPSSSSPSPELEPEIGEWRVEMKMKDEDGQNSVPALGTGLRIMLRWPILLYVDIAAASTASRPTRLPVYQL